jgi:uncharacterized coiled-coil protein SlyX
MLNMLGEMKGEMTNMVGEIKGTVGEISQTVNAHFQSIAKIETQMGQLANTLNRREDGKLPSQLVANPKGHYLVNEDTSYHQQVQAITTLRSRRLVDNQVEEQKDEHTEIPETLQRDKGKQVINDTSSSANPSSEAPYVPRAPFQERLKAPFHFEKQ